MKPEDTLTVHPYYLEAWRVGKLTGWPFSIHRETYGTFILTVTRP